MSEWKVPYAHPQGIAFIYGGGPSLRSIDVPAFTRIRNIGPRECVHIALNEAYRLSPLMDYIYFHDSHWYLGAASKSREFAEHRAKKVTVSPVPEVRTALGIHALIRGNRAGLSRDPSTLSHGNNAGYTAINLAYLLGCTDIILFGYDMGVSHAGEANWHTHYTELGYPIREDVYARNYLQHFPLLASELAKEDVHVWNTSLGSRLDVFPRIPVEDILYDILKMETRTTYATTQEGILDDLLDEAIQEEVEAIYTEYENEEFLNASRN